MYALDLDIEDSIAVGVDHAGAVICTLPGVPEAVQVDMPMNEITRFVAFDEVPEHFETAMAEIRLIVNA